MSIPVSPQHMCGSQRIRHLWDVGFICSVAGGTQMGSDHECECHALLVMGEGFSPAACKHTKKYLVVVL